MVFSLPFSRSVSGTKVLYCFGCGQDSGRHHFGKAADGVLLQQKSPGLCFHHTNCWGKNLPAFSCKTSCFVDTDNLHKFLHYSWHRNVTSFPPDANSCAEDPGRFMTEVADFAQAKRY